LSCCKFDVEINRCLPQCKKTDRCSKRSTNGMDSVGLNAAIKANTVAVSKVSEDQGVVGNPAHIVSTEGSEGYVNWTIDE